MSRVRFAWHGFLHSKLAILQSQLKNPHLAKLHPYSALSLIDGAQAKPCRAAPASLKYDFKDASERLDNLFINNYIKIKASTGMCY